MPIYDKPVRLLIPEMIKELAPQLGHPFSKESAVKWFSRHYPKIKIGTISAHLIRFSTNARTRLHYNAKDDEDLLFQIDGSHFRRHNQANDPTPIRSESEVGVSEDMTTETVDLPNPSEFAYERDLRNFLAKSLSLIEPGLQLYQEEGITGIEFPVGGRFIDILAIDSKNRLVVIELKVSRGYDRVIGQILRYMAWIEKNLADSSQGVRGIIASRTISEDLKLACSYLPNVSLYEYELSVSLKKIIIEALPGSNPPFTPDANSAR